MRVNSMGLRRLPVYLLLDCSSSMQGAPIIAVNEGLGMIYRELMKDPLAVETVYISIICFANRAEQYELTPIDQFIPPRLVADGITAMGAAFHVLIESFKKDLVVNTPTRRGDWCPLVFLLTDAMPTDNYREELKKFNALSATYKPTIVALGCGSHVQVSMLREVTNKVYLMQDITPHALRAFFRWVSNSIKGVTHAIGGDADETVIRPMNIPGIHQHNP